MSEERIEVSHLISFLKEVGKSNEAIVSILESIIKTYMMYGGSLQEKINYEFHTAHKESLRSGII
jgi:hypothetical protein